jgi:hypothetical protein
MWNKLFWFVIYHFSLVKAAMNAARICKLRNGVNKTHQFLNFSNAKSGTKTITHLSFAEGSSFCSLDRRIYDCKLQNEKDIIPVHKKYFPQLSKLLYNWQLRNKEALQFFLKPSTPL